VEDQEAARYGIFSRSPLAHPTLSCVEDQEAARYRIVSRYLLHPNHVWWIRRLPSLTLV